MEMTLEQEKNLAEHFKRNLDYQFQRGMYQAAYGLAGAIKDVIEELKGQKKKRLADYQKTIAKILALVSVDLKKPEDPEE